MTNEVKLENTAAKAPKKRKIASLDKRKARVGWIFVLPFLIGFAFVYLPIIRDSFWLAFNEMTIVTGGGYSLEFVGLKNFQEALFEDPGFVQTLITGIGELIFEVPAILLFSLFMAVLLNQKMAGRAAFRAIFFLPVVLATGIMESIESANILGTYMGESSGIDDGSGSSAASEIVSAMDIEMLFSNMKVGQELVTYVVSIINNIYGIVNRSGVQMLIFLAGLQSISPAIYEACRIDGATGWETFWKITFPMVSPMILVNGIYTIIDNFTTDSNSVMNVINETFVSPGAGKHVSAAMGWMYFMLILVIVGIVAAVFSAYVFYQRRD